MRKLFSLAVLLLLCSCGSAPQIQSYIGGTYYSTGPTGADDPQLLDPKFYMDDSDDLPAWTRAVPQSNR